jgi:hypothetical protein
MPNRLLRACPVRDVTEPQAREAARLRTATGRASAISATDAVVAAFASACPDPVVLTSDPHDLTASPSTQPADHNRPRLAEAHSC